MTDPLADLIAQVEEVVPAAGSQPAADRQGFLRMLISMELGAGALAGAEVDDQEATGLCYLATLLAHLGEHELAQRVLRDGADRSPERSRRARLTGLRGVLLAETGRLAEARTALGDALVDAAGAPAVAARVQSDLATLSVRLGDLEQARVCLGNAEALAAPDAGSAFDHAYARLQIALLREDADAATPLAGALTAACDEIVRRLPGRHPAAVAAVADLAYARFRLAALTGAAGQPPRCAPVLAGAARLLGDTLGEAHPRTLTTQTHRAECELHVALAGHDRAETARVAAATRHTAALAARVLGADHPQTIAADAIAALAGLAATALARADLAMARPSTGSVPPTVPAADAPTSTDPAADAPTSTGPAADTSTSTGPAVDTPTPTEPAADARSAAAALAALAGNAGRVLGRRHPLAVVLEAGSALAGFAAVPPGDRAEPQDAALAEAAVRAGLVLGVGHSIARLLDQGLTASRRPAPAAEPVPHEAAPEALPERSTPADQPPQGVSTDKPAREAVVPPNAAVPSDTALAPAAAVPPAAALPPDATVPPETTVPPDASEPQPETTAVPPESDRHGGEPLNADGEAPPDAAVEDAVSEAAGAESATADDASTEIASTERATADNASAESATAESTSADNAGTDNADAESTSPENTSPDNAGTESTSAESTSAAEKDRVAENARLAAIRERDERERTWDTLEKIREEGGMVRGVVVEAVKGGLVLDVGLRAFLPASLVEMRRVRDLQPYVGRDLEAKVLELDRARGNVVLSRRAWLEQNRSVARTGLLAQLQPGQIRRGVVSSVVNFGAFVDLGGVDGLISVAELAWTHHNHPSEVVDVGQEVEVEVLDVDLGRERISLSLKATQQDPWPQFARSHPIGQIVVGRVTKLLPFGAFVRVDGLEGLVHVSELADRHVAAPDEVVRTGLELLVKVTDIDLQRRRISLSLKQANAEFVEGEDHFDPVSYGMANTYDAEGNYIYPEGFDPETAEWMPGFEAQREAWEGQYAEAHSRWEAHGRQVRAARDGSATPEFDGRLAALRERLSDGNRREPGQPA